MKYVYMYKNCFWPHSRNAAFSFAATYGNNWCLLCDVYWRQTQCV